MTKTLFIHGYESSGDGFKGVYLSQRFPHLFHPTFQGDLDQRMQALYQILEANETWTLIGSSFGGLMATRYACEFPEKVSRLILLAPALIAPYANSSLCHQRIEIPTLLIHGQNDDIVPLGDVLPVAQRLFQHLEFRLVDDDHLLHKTVESLDWQLILVRKTE